MILFPNILKHFAIFPLQESFPHCEYGVGGVGGCVLSHLVMPDSATPWTIRQASLSMGFSRQEYRSELPLPSPGGLPDPGIELVSATLTGGFLTSGPSGKPISSLFLNHSHP